MKLSSLVVGVDFSEASTTALAKAASLAHRYHAQLLVLHVVDQSIMAEMRSVFQRPAAEVEQQIQSNLLGELAALAQRVGAPPDRQLQVLTGHPLHEVLDQCRAVAADLLVLGVNGAGGSRDTGSLALKAARKAPAPVLLVASRQSTPFRKAVLGVDFSQDSCRLVELAAPLLAPDAQLDLLHVFSPPWQRLHYLAPTPAAAPDLQAEFRRIIEAQLQTCLNRVPQALRQNLNIRCVLQENAHPAHGILEYLEQQQAELVVLSARGASQLRPIFLGSTSERVIRHVPCSVLTARSADLQRQVA